jgi:putative ABC transport system permease protein
MPLVAWLREVGASALSQRVSTAMTLLFVLSATAVVLITAGRAAGAEAAVLADIDAVGTRTLTVRVATPHDDFSAALVDRIAAHHDVVDEVTGFGPVTDVTATEGSAPVAMRAVYGSLAGKTLAPMAAVAGTPQALATSDAVTTLGLLAGRGSVYGTDGTETLITGDVELPAHLASMNPVVLVPGQGHAEEPVTTITLVAHKPANLPLITDLVTGALSDLDPTTVTIETSQRLADLRAVLEGQLTRQSHTLVLGILVGSAFAIMVNVWSLALTRRKDFGRRRALGATRTMIVGLVTGQVAIIATVGAVAGVATGTAVIAVTGDPLPPASYLVAVAAAFITASIATAAVPAVWAANRDPLTELRVP